MEQIKLLVSIGEDYSCGGKFFDDGIKYTDETGNYMTIYNEFYNCDYRDCYDEAKKFINYCSMFSDLTPEQVIKTFAGMEFKNELIFVIDYSYNSTCHYTVCSLIFYELFVLNKEMLVAIIKAVSSDIITRNNLYFLLDYSDRNNMVGMAKFVCEDYIIEMYKQLLKCSYFSVDNLNLSDEIKNYLRPTNTKKAI